MAPDKSGRARPPASPARRRRRRGPRHALLSIVLAVLVVVVAACGGGQSGRVDPAAHVVDLPGAAHDIDFDDIVYSGRLQRVLVPARDSGLYLIDPDNAVATRVPNSGHVDSADEGRGMLFLLDRSRRTVTVLDPSDGRVVSSFATASGTDYLRYIPVSNEVWITEPGRSPSGIEVFALTDGSTPAGHAVGFVPVPDGPEGFAAGSPTAYTHAGTDLVAIDVATRAVTARWPTGCDGGTHGFPRVDERAGLVLASCAADGQVSLLDARDGHQLGHYSVGGGEALPAFSATKGHFYVRSDPGTAVATLQPSDSGLTPVHRVEVPQAGHCLTADDRGHYWTCDAAHGRILRFDDA